MANKYISTGIIKSIEFIDDVNKPRVIVIIKARDYSNGKEYFEHIICYAYSGMVNILMNDTKIGDWVSIEGKLCNNGIAMYVVITNLELIGKHIVDGNK